MIHLAKYHLLVVPAMGSSSIKHRAFASIELPSGRTIALVAIASLWGQRHRSASELSQKKTSGLPLCTVVVYVIPMFVLRKSPPKKILTSTLRSIRVNFSVYRTRSKIPTYASRCCVVSKKRNWIETIHFDNSVVVS